MQTKADGSIEIMDLRHCSRKSLYNLQGIRAKIYTLTESVIKKDRLIKELSINGYTKEEIEESLADLMDNRLILNIGEEYLALAIEEVQ